MEKLLDKKKILAEAIKKHRTVIRDFQERISAMMYSEGNVNEESYDIQEQSFKSENTEKVGFLSEQLAFANRELDELIRMQSELGGTHDRVQRGSVVVTDKETFFVSTSIERFQADGKPLFGLSVLTPLFSAMKGKKKGEEFTYRDIGYRILEVY